MVAMTRLIMFVGIARAIYRRMLSTGGGAEHVDGVPAARRGRHLQHRGRHRQPAQHDRYSRTLHYIY